MKTNKTCEIVPKQEKENNFIFISAIHLTPQITMNSKSNI
jgi:hypothetical protein